MSSSAYQNLNTATFNASNATSNLQNEFSSFSSNYQNPLHTQTNPRFSADLNLQTTDTFNLRQGRSQSSLRDEWNFTMPATAKNDALRFSPQKPSNSSNHIQSSLNNGRTVNLDQTIDSIKDKETIQKLKAELRDKAETLTKFNKLMKVKYDELKQIKAESQEKDSKIAQLTQQLQEMQKYDTLKNQLFLYKKQNHDLKEKINNPSDIFKNEVFQKKIESLSDQLYAEQRKSKELELEKSEFSQRVRELEEKCGQLNYESVKQGVLKQNDQLQNLKLFSSEKNQNLEHLKAFDDALKVQMRQTAELKQVLQSGQEENQRLRDNVTAARKELDKCRAEMKVWEVKAHSERNKLITEYRLQLHEKANEIDTLYKKYKTMEDKYRNSLNEIKTKDDFFKQHLVGRTNEIDVKEYIESTLERYAGYFDDVVNLQTENKRLQEQLTRFQSYEAKD